METEAQTETEYPIRYQTTLEELSLLHKVQPNTKVVFSHEKANGGEVPRSTLYNLESWQN